MPDYEKLKRLCEEASSISRTVIDDFLVYYAAFRDKQDREFDVRIERFRAMEKKMPAAWTPSVKMQYIGHRLFKQGGLIHKYLRSEDLKNREAEELNFLQELSASPWKFSFSVILDHPAPDFYEMEDVFRGEQYLLYSPAVTQTLSDHPVSLWFNLIFYNGSCWQTYGPLTGLQSYGPDDIFFYATELNESIDSDEELLEDVEKNPVPYMMLMSGSTHPILLQSGYEAVLIKGEAPLTGFDFQTMKNDFRIQFDSGVFKLSHKTLSDPPHLAEVYYDEKESVLHASAMTDYGYHELIGCLNGYGIDFPIEPDIRIHPSLLDLIRKLLNKKVNLFPYNHLFEEKKSPESEEFLAKLNQVLSMALPEINAGRKPDAEALARKLDLDPETVRDILDNVIGRVDKLKKDGPFGHGPEA
ncbi:MAG TPA: hypothetical protein PKM27_14095 [Saprospiraceae bacterium]|nr:hypothetical protein [Saprospiraceae bacterium]HNT21062.1 hypothetical protein [Saprospiraceae bacterium]